MTNDGAKCELCGERMPVGEESFKYHGFSGPCPVSITSKSTEMENESDEGRTSNGDWTAPAEVTPVDGTDGSEQLEYS